MKHGGQICVVVAMIAAGCTFSYAEPLPADALKGCWELRGVTPGEAVTYCFDAEVAGEFVTRASGGDGWDGGGRYSIDGDRIRLDEGEGRTCAFAISGDVLTLNQCVADQTMAAGEPIEDTTWARVPQ
jgi:hypothetical protein